MGRVGGIGIQPRPAGVALDLIPEADNARIGFNLGPAVRVRLDRRSRDGMKDDVVAALGKRDIGVEVGPTVGVSLNRVFHGYDSITLSSDFRWDIAGGHGGMVIAPSITYFTPLSRGAAMGLSVSAEHIDDDYADYYYSVTPAGSVASGLPTFAAKGGWKSVGATMFGVLDLDGDLTNGGFALFGMGSYSRMQDDAARSPIVSIRGSADQWVGALGVGYTF
jgi:outer membrane scaffolding protein for murein synthesis (MipA/OmpV family)